MDNIKIAFIGAGNMTRSLVGGLIADGYPSKNLWASNPSQEKLDFFQSNFGINTTLSNRFAVEQADVVVLGVKPMILQSVCTEIKDPIASRRPLIVSVAVGATEALLQQWLGHSHSIIRAIPNTPSMVSAGATGLFAGQKISAEQKNLAETLFRATGITVWVDDENQLDAICAVSGCGPGYIFLIMESIEKAAVKIGLPPQLSRLLTAQTLLGTARMALESEQPLAQLRQHVTSPKGTTEQAINVLEKGHISQLIADALQAALARAKEITEQLAAESE